MFLYVLLFMEYDTIRNFKSQLTDYSVIEFFSTYDPNGPYAFSSNTFCEFCLEDIFLKFYQTLMTAAMAFYKMH